MADTTSAVPPALTQLLAQSVQRQQYQNPLFQAVTNQAFQGLPTYARQGLSLGSSLPPIDPNLLKAGGGGGGGINPALMAALGALAGGPGAGGNLGNLIGKLIDLFKRNGSGFHASLPGQPLLPGNPSDNSNSFTGWPDQYADEYPWDPQNTQGPAPTPHVDVQTSFNDPELGSYYGNTDPSMLPGGSDVSTWQDPFANQEYP